MNRLPFRRRLVCRLMTGALMVSGLARGAEAQCPDGSPPPCPRSVRVDTNRFVVLPFTVRGPPSVQYLGESMVDLLHIALDGVGKMRVEYAPSAIRRLGQLPEPQDSRAAAGTALELGAGRIIGGTVVALGSDVRIRAEVYDAARNRTQFSVERRANIDNLPAVVDSLAAAILARRLVPAAERHRLSVGEYATKSPKALNAYLVARQHARRGERREASDSLKSALKNDPDFGLAYLLLRRTEATQGGVSGISLDSIDKAARARMARLPERVRARFDQLSGGEPGDRVRVLALAQMNAERFPSDPEMAFYLADAYFHHGLNLGEPREHVIAAFRRAIALDDQDPELLSHFEVLLWEAGDTTASKAIRQRLCVTAERFCENDVDVRAVFRREDPRKLAVGADSLYWGTSTHGLVRSAAWDPGHGLALTDSFAQIQTAPGRATGLRSNAWVVRSNVALARGQYELAWSFLDSAATVGSPRGGFQMLHHIVTGTHGSVAIKAWWAAVRQTPDSAEPYLRLLEERSWPQVMTGPGIAAGLRGLVALRLGDTARAIEQFSRARRLSTPNTSPLRVLSPRSSVALLLAQIEAARSNWARAKLYLADLYPINDYVPFIGDVEETRARVALALADTAAAKTHLRNVIAVWDKADAVLQPRVAAARATLARLENQ